MFSFFKKNRKSTDEKTDNNIIESPEFGKMKYLYVWRALEPVEINIFGKAQSINCSAAANKLKEVPNDIQEAAFKKFQEEKEKLISEAEKIVLDFFKPDESFDMSKVITIMGIHISRKGECGLKMLFNEDYLFDFDLDELGIEHGQYFGVSLFPELRLIKSGDEYGNIFVDQK